MNMVQACDEQLKSPTRWADGLPAQEEMNVWSRWQEWDLNAGLTLSSADGHTLAEDAVCGLKAVVMSVQCRKDNMRAILPGALPVSQTGASLKMPERRAGR